jgi:hypothetical protein
VAVGADGSGLMAWSETAADGAPHVYARRLTPLMSIPPSDLGAPAGQPDVDIEDDADFAWVVLTTLGPTSHTVARRFLGSTFDPPVPIDGGTPAQTPSIDFGGDGEGDAVSAGAGNAVLWSQLTNDAFKAPLPIGGGSGPLTAVSEHEDSAVTWLVAPGVLHGRYKPGGRPFDPEVPLTDPAAGAVAPGGYDISADRVGDTAVALAQGPDGARAISAAVWDRPPGRPFSRPVKSFRSRGRPRFRWVAGRELWGAQVFQVQVDGRVVGTTGGTSLVPAQRLAGGRHRWRVVAVDRRGQPSASVARTLRLPSTGFRIRLRVTGSRRVGARLRFVVRVSARRGGRVKRITVDYGDGTHATRKRVSTHRYRAVGAYPLTVRAFDRAGNFAEKRATVRIR